MERSMPLNEMDLFNLRRSEVQALHAHIGRCFNELPLANRHRFHCQ